MTKEDLEKYQKKLDKEDMDLLSSVDSSIEAMREDLDYYLKKAGALDIIEKSREVKVSKEEKPSGFFEPLFAIGDFIREVVGVEKGGKKGKSVKPSVGETKSAEGVAKLDAYLAYYVFKKQHGLLTE